METMALRLASSLAIAIPAIELTDGWMNGQRMVRQKLDMQSCMDWDDETGPRPSESIVVVVDNGVARQSCSVGMKNQIKTKT